VQGVGEKWHFSATSRGFGYGYEAVRIRVKEFTNQKNCFKHLIIKNRNMPALIVNASLV
jgi:hypothetical protein